MMHYKPIKNNSNISTGNTPALTIVTLWSLLFVSIVFLSGCGISDVPAFFSASLSKIGEGVIQLSHNTANNTSAFVGYEVYYKLYDSSDTATISSDRNYITGTEFQPVPSLITTKKFRMFIPVNFINNDFNSLEFEQYPLVKIPSSTLSKEFFFDFSAGTEVYPNQIPASNYVVGINDNNGFQALLIEDTGDFTFLHRNLNSSQFKTFFDTKGQQSYEVEDSDIQSMVGDDYTYGDELLIVIAVIPFGVDFTAARIYGDIAVSIETRFDYTQIP